MPEPTASKHAAIEHISLEECRTILRSAHRSGGIGIEEVVRVMDCTAQRADQLLRSMAQAGYLEPADVWNQVFFWTLTPNGNRLAMERKQKRFGSDKLQTAIRKLVARAQNINSDPDRLQRVTLKLFGSALAERDDYGDVDVSIAYHRRHLGEEERARIEELLVSRQSEHERQTILGQIMGAEQQDIREIRGILKKGLPHVSFMKDDPMELGTPFRWLVDHDMETDTSRSVSESVVRPNKASFFERGEPVVLPEVTMVQARHRAISPGTKVSTNGILLGVQDVAKIEEAMWSPWVNRDGSFTPNDVRSDPKVKFAGFQHLCPVWKEPVGGILMLKKALEWCDANKVWVRELFPVVSIHRGDRSNIIRLGRVGELIYFKVGPTTQDGSLMPINRSRVSKIDLAGSYAVARALIKMYTEARCLRAPSFSAELFVPQLDVDSLPEFPKLIKSGGFQVGAFNGLISAERH